jgi:putative membrane protein insertion efficiency factor
VRSILHKTGSGFHTLALWTVLAAIGVYRLLISPLLAATFGPVCRFQPCCSEYARQAFIEHGLGRGFYLTIRRLSRCHPLGGWGYDPVPSVPAHHDARPASSLKEKFG